MREAAERGDALPFTPRSGQQAGATATVNVASVPSPLREGMMTPGAVADASAATPKSGGKRGESGGGLLRMVGLSS